jgi:hypothetical protein
MSTDSATQGSALYQVSDSLQLISSIVDGTCAGAVHIDSLDGNLESPGATCGLGAGDLSNVADPGLSQLADFGGPTPTVLPLPGSPALGTGNICSIYPEDQRGLPRDNPGCDSGAVERQSSDPSPVFLDGFESGDASGW